jgi:hypothetical protein
VCLPTSAATPKSTGVVKTGDGSRWMRRGDLQLPPLEMKGRRFHSHGSGPPDANAAIQSDAMSAFYISDASRGTGAVETKPQYVILAHKLKFVTSLESARFVKYAR